jgi:integrase
VATARDTLPRGQVVAREGFISRLVKLTVRTIETAAPGVEIRDVVVPGLRLRVSPKGLRRFVMVTHYPGQKHAARRALRAVDLKEAREEALEWRRLVRQGVDPYEEARRREREELRKRTNTFASVAEAYIADCHRRGHRTAAVTEREIRRELISQWADRPISDITRSDVVALIQAIRDRPSPYSAHTTFGLIRALFSWGIELGAYGLETSPTDHVKASRLIGAKQPRERVLDDDEIRALWIATAELGYPYGPLLRMLLLTGQRRSEVAEARWPEFNFEAKIWTVPAERFKSGSTHIVPLTADVLGLLNTLRRFNSGNFLFSVDFGKTPVTSFPRVKARLDKLMLKELRKADADAKLPAFVLHDLRRTMRTRLSSLRVPDTVAEQVIGHGRRGLQRIYDQHKFVDEMREALEAWNARLRAIVTPPSANGVTPANKGAGP